MKKILALVACLSILATVAIGGSIAYLTDTDSDTNVMVMGNVDIIQHEDFENNKPLLPAQTVTKAVTVENVGKSPAYIRTFVAFEKDPENIVDFTKNDTVEENSTDWTWRTPTYSIIVGDVAYDVYEVVYNTILEKDKITAESLKTVSMKAEATNDQVKMFNSEYTVLVLSQAVQTTSFENPALTFDQNRDAAFKAAFQGNADLNDEMIQKWFEEAKSDEVATPDSSATVWTDETLIEEGNRQYVFEDNQLVYSGIEGTLETPLTSAIAHYTDENGVDHETVIVIKNADLTVLCEYAFDLDVNATIIIMDSQFALEDGDALVYLTNGQVIFSNVTVNGEQITKASDYVAGGASAFVTKI